MGYGGVGRGVGGVTEVRELSNSATPGSQSIPSYGKAKRSRRHNSDTTPSIRAHMCTGRDDGNPRARVALMCWSSERHTIFGGFVNTVCTALLLGVIRIICTNDSMVPEISPEMLQETLQSFSRYVSEAPTLTHVGSDSTDVGSIDLNGSGGQSDDGIPEMAAPRTGSFDGVNLGSVQLLDSTTILSVNAACLLESSGRRLKNFETMIASTVPRPDIIVVHELNGYSGKLNVRALLKRGALRSYDCEFSQKPMVDGGKHKAGGGIAILFKKSKFKASVFSMTGDADEIRMLDGHLRTYSLWRRELAHLPPLVVTVLYLPPKARYKALYLRELRAIACKATLAMVDKIKTARKGSQHVIVAHANSPDGLMDIGSNLSKILSAQQQMRAPVVPLSGRGMHFTKSKGKIILQRTQVKSMVASTPAGRAFSNALSRRGLLPCAGVSEPLVPSTWRVCKAKCKGECTCDRSRMSGLNDVIYIPEDTLWHGYMNGSCKASLQKKLWDGVDGAIDHSILLARIPLFGYAAPSRCPRPKSRRVQRRTRFPLDLLRRAILMSLMTEQQDIAIQKPNATILSSWSEVKPQAQVKITKAVLTPSEISAAFKNGPGKFWEHQLAFASDPGSSGSISSAMLRECLSNEDGSLITSDPKECVRLIEEHRALIASIPATLPMPEEVVYHSLRNVSVHNRTIPGLAPESVAAMTALNPACLWRIPNPPPRRDQNNLEGYALWDSLNLPPNGSLAAYDAVKSMHSSACDALSAPFELTEISKVFSSLQDVGAGVDGLPPVIFRQHAEHGACAVATTLLTELNMVLSAGVTPPEWQSHRLILTYKRHDDHPNALSSYRGIGIGVTALKIMSLALNERLNTFLETTNALSPEQLGFRRMSGTQESVLTVSETIRHAAKESNVFCAFLDIAGAYDTVIRPLLYDRCVQIGVGGRFLSTIQALYKSPIAEIEIDGNVIGAVPIERGLLQGSPLSPSLFNIYIDGCIRDLKEKARLKSIETGKPFGLYLPTVQPPPSPSESPGRNDSENGAAGGALPNDRVLSVWYADDGALLEVDMDRLQWMLNTLIASLTLMGLVLNVRKTKLLVTLHHKALWWSEPILRDYINSTSPLIAYGSKIETVTEFPYLGILLNSRGNWCGAWSKARCRANLSSHEATLGGFQFHAGSLASMLIFAHAKIWCHLDYLFAITGTGGCKSSAPYLNADECIDNVLKRIAGHGSLNASALRIESGVWDTVSRSDMLITRFFTKICSTSPDTLPYRAAHLSMSSLSDVECSDPANKWSAIHLIHRQSWAQQVLAAAQRLSMPLQMVRNMQPGILLRLQERRFANDQQPWVDVVNPLSFTPDWTSDVRLSLLTPPRDGIMQEGVNTWTVNACDVVQGKPLLSQWTEPLRLANHCAIRAIANKKRRSLVRAFTTAQKEDDSYLAMWARMSGDFSFLPAYWHIHDVHAARAMLRIILNDGYNEEAVRRRTIRTKAIPSRPDVVVSDARLPRIEDATLRACYLCGPIADCVGIYYPETLFHTLMECAHPRMCVMREKLRADISSLALSPAALAISPNPPAVFDKSELWATMMLCSSTDGFPTRTVAIAEVNQPPPLRRSGRVPPPPAIRRDGHPQFARLQADGRTQVTRLQAMAVRSARPVIDFQAMGVASNWLVRLLEHWTSSLRAYHTVGETECTPGSILATMVCEHMRRSFSEHRNALRTDVEYAQRSRDPAVHSTLNCKSDLHPSNHTYTSVVVNHSVAVNHTANPPPTATRYIDPAAPCAITTAVRSKSHVTTALDVTPILPTSKRAATRCSAVTVLKPTTARSSFTLEVNPIIVLSDSARQAAISALDLSARTPIPDSQPFFNAEFSYNCFRSSILDFTSLKGCKWLTGRIINDFLFHEILFPRLAYQNGEFPMSCRPNVVLFDTLFYKSITRLGYSVETNVNEMIIYLESRGRSVYVDTTEIIMPIHVNNNHWILAIMDFKFRTLYLIDPYQRSRERHTQISQVLLELLSRLAPDYTGRWTLLTAITNLPKQTDGYSCGVFVAFYAMFWFKYRKFPSTEDFTQQQVPHMRLFMASRLSSAARGDLHALLQRNGLLPYMLNLPIVLRDMFLDIPDNSFRTFLDKPSSRTSDPPVAIVISDSPPRLVHHQSVASHDGATASPQTRKNDCS